MPLGANEMRRRKLVVMRARGVCVAGLGVVQLRGYCGSPTPPAPVRASKVGGSFVEELADPARTSRQDSTFNYIRLRRILALGDVTGGGRRSVGTAKPTNIVQSPEPDRAILKL